MKSSQIEIKRLGPSDVALAQKLFWLMQQVFKVENPDTITEAYVVKILANTTFVVFAALYNSEPVGGITGDELPMYNAETAEMYIYDIAIKPEFQRMGIGKKLIAAAKRHCSKNNIKTLYVQADAEDKHALDFYRSTGASESKVVHFTYNIAPGK